MSKLIAPNGKTIIGTVDVIPCCALLGEVRGKDADGTFDFDYAGESEIQWDGQTTRTVRGRRIFRAEDGSEWLEHKLRLVNDDEPKTS